MRMPNGFGSVYKLSGKRRKPYCARITTNWYHDGERLRQERKIIGYASTKTEAFKLLADYNQNPSEPENNMTFEECYMEWYKEASIGKSKSSLTGYKNGYAVCKPFANMPIKDIKLSDLEDAAKASLKNKPALGHFKNVVSLVFKWAHKHEYITIEKKAISSYFDLNKFDNPNARETVPFTEEEIEYILEHYKEFLFGDVLVILLFTGARISEILNLKKEDVHIDEHYFHIATSKTETGIRDVPIADRLMPIFEYYYNNSPTQYLLHFKNKRLTYHIIKNHHWALLMAELCKNEHNPHDARHTFISRMATKKVDERIVKRIVGHADNNNITNSTYTHFDMKILLDAVNIL